MATVQVGDELAVGGTRDFQFLVASVENLLQLDDLLFEQGNAPL